VPGHRWRRRHAAGHAIEFDLIGATRQTDFHAPVADHVEQRAFTGDPQRVPERRDDGAGAEVDGGGFGGEVGQQWHRARRDGVFHGVVFADPHGAETAGLGHQGQFGQVFEQLAVADAFVPAFHVDEQGKFHDAYLGSFVVEATARWECSGSRSCCVSRLLRRL
jgi:hypothetical protein